MKSIFLAVFAASVSTLILRWAGLTYVQMLVVDVFIFLVWIGAMAWYHPSQQLAHQARKLGWRAVNTVKQPDGSRDMFLVKDRALVYISYRESLIHWLDGERDIAFRNFDELETTLVENHFINN